MCEPHSEDKQVQKKNPESENKNFQKAMLRVPIIAVYCLGGIGPDSGPGTYIPTSQLKH